MNWNSDTGTWSDVVGDETKALRARARALRAQGVPVRQIAAQLQRSVSRIYELLR